MKTIVVIGAGPAGSNLARLVDTEKYRVILIDGSKKKGEKVCGGLLSPDAQDLLAKYDISLPKDVLVSPQLFSVRTIDLGIEEMQYYRRSYMNVNREKFDQFLRDMVSDKVQVVDGVCKKVERKGKGFQIKISTDEETQIIDCDYVVGAEGANSIVRRDLFPDKKIQRYTSIQQWFPKMTENPFYSCIFDNDTSPSCSWIFFKDEFMVFGGAFAPEHCREAFEEQKRKLINRGIVSKKQFENPVRTEACMVARPHLLEGIFRGEDGAFLIGEAAGFISASSLEGISFALSSGEALAEAFEKGVDSKAILRYYKRNTDKLCLKVKTKCVKRPFMYNRVLRAVILKTGVAAIQIKMQEKKA